MVRFWREAAVRRNVRSLGEADFPVAPPDFWA